MAYPSRYCYQCAPLAAEDYEHSQRKSQRRFYEKYYETVIRPARGYVARYRPRQQQEASNG